MKLQIIIKSKMTNHKHNGTQFVKSVFSPVTDIEKYYIHICIY